MAACLLLSYNLTTVFDGLTLVRQWKTEEKQAQNKIFSILPVVKVVQGLPQTVEVIPSDALW